MATTHSSANGVHTTRPLQVEKMVMVSRPLDSNRACEAIDRPVGTKTQGVARRAASMTALSIFFIFIMASKARLAAA